MNQKFLMVLFSTIIFNGVTYSYPVNEQISDVKLAEEKLSATSLVSVDNNKKLESATAIADHSAPVTQKVTVTEQHSEISATKNSIVSSESGDNSTVLNSPTVDVKNASQDSVIPSSKNVSLVIDKKKSNQTADQINANATVPENVPAGNNSIASSAFIPAEKNMTALSPSPYTTSDTTTSVRTTIKSVVTTVVPTTIVKNNVVAEQNTPAPVEEKHFDGPSFIGGIVLTIGLTAIGFIAFKYYKSGKIDMNYRTL